MTITSLLWKMHGRYSHIVQVAQLNVPLDGSMVTEEEKEEVAVEDAGITLRSCKTK